MVVDVVYFVFCDPSLLPYRCPALLVVGDTSPAVEAVVSPMIQN